MAQDPDVRWRQRFHSFGKAFAQLKSAADLERARGLSELERQGLIQAFEFTHELAWNTLKDYLESRGATALYGSRDVTREAFARGLVDNGEEWMAMIQCRNRSSHTYNEVMAKQVSDAIVTSFVREFATFQTQFATLESRES
jgi:nucleotidyltransferase substrate binding protein (TIGR01987 family)